MKESKILLSHGSGGAKTHSLIKDIILKYVGNPILNKLTDASILKLNSNNLAFTTDTFVVDPIFFPGGNIGSLSIHGTVNDLAVMGAKPEFLSLAMVIEEGFELEEFENILKSIYEASKNAKVTISTGDTKVVPKGSVDKIFINTSGIGILHPEVNLGVERIKPGDVILINGYIAEHGLAVFAKRKGIEIEHSILSDSQPLNLMIEKLFSLGKALHFMRDPTRGGIASVVNEIVENQDFSIMLYEEKIPIKDEVKAYIDILGFDPLHIANEGKVLIICDREKAEETLEIMRNTKEGENAQIIGEVIENPKGMAILKTIIGGKRIIDFPIGELLPRIC